MRTVFISLEILDNPPHNKISRCSQMGEMLQDELQISASVTSDSMG